jgi:hypothetical protein
LSPRFIVHKKIFKVFPKIHETYFASSKVEPAAAPRVHSNQNEFKEDLSWECESEQTCLPSLLNVIWLTTKMR